MRKGYLAEYLCKKELIKKYGKENVFKVAIGGATDFFVLAPGKTRILKIVEVKQTKKNKWYPSSHDIKQFKLIEKISKEHRIPVEYWIRIKRKWFILSLKQVKKQIKNYLSSTLP